VSARPQAASRWRRSERIVQEVNEKGPEAIPAFFIVSTESRIRHTFLSLQERLDMSFFSLRACMLAGLLAISPALAIAKTYAIPDPNPIVTITIPDDWETEETDRGGLESTSDDEGVYFTIEATDVDALDKITERAMAALIVEGVKINQASEKKTDIAIGDIKGFTVFWEAKDDDGPTQVSVTVLLVSDKMALLMTGWGTEAGQKANLKELTGIMESIKVIK
jgi:hypothetical protein